MEERKGRQDPTVQFILPYTDTDGSIAVKLYNLTGRTAMPWQENLMYDILAKNEDGLWKHTRFGYSIPRRNGKGEILLMRELYALASGEHVLHTAHRTSTSHAAWERLCKIMDMLSIPYDSIRAKGQEFIKLKDGGKIDFRTRTSKGGLGEGFDLLVIDEAQEYQADQESTLKYTVTDSKNPQTIMCGTPPTPISSGTVFVDYRATVLSGAAEDAGWAEWSIKARSDPSDRDLWFETNPSLGTTLSERNVANEVGTTEEKVVDFNIQRLGLWIGHNQKSVISKTEWDACLIDSIPKMQGKLAIGIKSAKGRETASVSVAVRTIDNRIFVESIGCKSVRDGIIWISSFCNSVGKNSHRIVIDAQSIQDSIESSLKQMNVKGVVIPSLHDLITANAQFEQMVVNKTICHMDQPGLNQAITNCVHRAIGSKGGFGFESTNESIDISLMDSVILAVWALTEFKDQKKFFVAY